MHYRATTRLVEPMITVAALFFGFMLTVAGMLATIERKATGDVRESRLFPLRRECRSHGVSRDNAVCIPGRLMR